MSNFRKDLRQNLKNHFLNETQAEARVFVSRTNPLEHDQDYPVLLIYSESESSAPVTQSRSIFVRTYRLTLEIRCLSGSESGDGDGLDDSLDEIAAQVEARMATFKMPGLKDIEYTGAETDLDGEGVQGLGSMKLNFDFKYIR